MIYQLNYSSKGESMDTELTVKDILKYFFEEVFRDGLYEDDEKDLIMNLRREFDIPPDEFLAVMKEVDQKFKRGELEYRERSIESDQLEIYTRILQKAFEDNIISAAEEELIFKVADLLAISRSVHNRIKTEKGFTVSDSKPPVNRLAEVPDKGESLLTEDDIIAFLECS